MAGQRARTLVYDDVRDAGQAFPTVDQFTEFTAIAASFIPSARPTFNAPPPSPFLTSTATSPVATTGTDSPELESILKSFTERLLAIIADAMGTLKGASGPGSELGIPEHLRKEERRESGPGDVADKRGPDAVDLPELPVADDPHSRVLARAAAKRAARLDRMGRPPEKPIEPEEDDAFLDIAPEPLPPKPPKAEPAFEIPDRDFDVPPPAIPESRGGAPVEDVDSMLELTSSYDTDSKPTPPSPPEPPSPPKQPAFAYDEINDIFALHGMPTELPDFVRQQQRPRRGSTPDDPLGHRRYADEKHDEALSNQGVVDSMLAAQEDLGRQHNNFNELLLDYLERLGNDNNNDERRLRALNSKLQRDRTSLTDVNI